MTCCFSASFQQNVTLISFWCSVYTELKNNDTDSDDDDDSDKDGPPRQICQEDGLVPVIAGRSDRTCL